MKRLQIPNNNQDYKRILRLFTKQEFCSWATPFLTCLYRPLSVLALSAFASLLCGLFVAPQGYVVFAALIAVISIGCLWPWIGIRGISCDLSFHAARTEEGKPVEAELVITNRWPWPVWGLSVEGGFSQEEDCAEQATIAVSRIGAWARGHFRWSFTPKVRGHFPTTTPQLVTEFPFGLWKAKQKVQVLSTVIVWPERFPLPPLMLPDGYQSWTGQPSENTAGNLGHRTAVREYRRNDSMRQIHWAKTALYDKLISFEREGVSVADATVSLDTHPVLHRGSGRSSSVEWTIRIAASVCETLLRQGIQVTIVSHAGQFQATSIGNSIALLDWFALHSTSGESVKSSPFSSRSTRWNNSLVIHITTDLSQHLANNSIVFATRPNTDSESSEGRFPQTWITLNQENDIPSQLRRGWRNGLGSIRHAV